MKTLKQYMASFNASVSQTLANPLIVSSHDEAALCPTPVRLAVYLFGDFPNTYPIYKNIEAHVKSCPKCQKVKAFCENEKREWDLL